MFVLKGAANLFILNTGVDKQEVDFNILYICMYKRCIDRNIVPTFYHEFLNTNSTESFQLFHEYQLSLKKISHEQSHLYFCFFDKKGKTEFLDNRLLKILGIPIEEKNIPKTVTDLFFDDISSEELIKINIGKVKSIPTKSGIEVHFKSKKRNELGLTLLTLTIQGLENNNELSKGFIIDELPQILFSRNIKSNSFTFYNEKFQEITGYQDIETTLQPIHLRQFVHPNDQHKFLKSLRRHHKLTLNTWAEIEFRLKDKNGNWKWMLYKEKAINKNLSGETELLLGVIADISESKAQRNILEEKNNLLQILLDTGSNYISILDKNYRIIMTNKSIRDTFGLVTGKTPFKGEVFLNYIPKYLHNDFKKHFAQALNGELVEIEREIKLAKEHEWWVNIKYQPAYNSDGDIFGVSINSHDITERVLANKVLEQKEQLIQSINQNISEGLYRSKREQGVLYANKAFAQLFGYNLSELDENFDLTNFYVNPNKRSLLKKKIIENGIVENEEILFKRKDGSTFWGLISSRFFIDESENIFFDGAVRDVTQQKLIHEQLESAKKRAEEMNRLKTNFLANMSHEIRTPINGIIGITQVMELEEDLDTIKSYLDLLRESGERLLNTITSILDLARLESEESDFKLNAMSVNRATEETKDFFEVLARKKKINLFFLLDAEDDIVLANEVILIQILNNLIGNAIKFTSKGFVKITTTNTYIEDKKHILLSVIDSGTGISKEFLPKVFMPFQQESMGMNRNFEGSGLGLSICKKYAEQLGGDLIVSSKLNEGSTFTLKLPLYED